MSRYVPWILLLLVAGAGGYIYAKGDKVEKELKALIEQKEQERETALAGADSLQREVASADSLAEAIERQLRAERERSEMEVTRLRSHAGELMAQIDSLREEVPPHVYELVQELQKTHEEERAEWSHQIRIMDQRLAWKDMQITERDRYIVHLRNVIAKDQELIDAQARALNPSFTVKLKQGLPKIAVGIAVGAVAVAAL